jgi:hypothetical protein
MFIFVLASCGKDESVTSQNSDPKPPEADPVEDTSYSDAQLKSLTDGFASRRLQAFEILRGKQLVRGAVQNPISSSGIPYYRALSYSLIDFAAKCFWLDELNQVANDALVENCNIYLDKQEVMRDGDSFYWAADELCRIIEYWGSNGIVKSGLLNSTTEASIYKMMWQWVKDQSKLKESQQLNSYLYSVCADFTQNNTWDVEGSENHHIQRFFTKWHFSKLLKERTEYKGLKYDDGYTAAEHFDGWNKYIKQYLRERAKKGLFIEFANDAYGMESLKGIYNFYDFGDSELKSLTGKFLDLFWATWAQEQLNGVSGGSKARVYQGRESYIGATHFRKLAWYYLNVGSISEIKQNIFSFITSEYRMPYVVMDMALDTKGKGNYEIIQRRLGLAKDGYYSPLPFYRIDQTKGLVRYSYCTPNFIMGTFHCEALNESQWTMISSQNRWMGVIFSADPNSRIYPQCEGTDKGVYNQHWGVQSKGCMIAQRLGNYSKNAGKMRVWISDNGLGQRIESNGWIFVSSTDKKSYAAIKFVDGKYTTSVVNEVGLWSGHWVSEVNSNTPVIIEVANASGYSSYEDFQAKVQALPLTYSNGIVKHTTLYGDNLEFYANYSHLPMINGKTIDLNPAKVMDGPFVSSDFNSGVYVIKKGARILNLNFNN